MKTYQSDISFAGHGIKNVGRASASTDVPSYAQTYQSKSISILNPIAGDAITLWIANDALKIQSVKYSIIGGETVALSIYAGDTVRSTEKPIISTMIDGYATSVIGSSTISCDTVEADDILWLSVDDIAGIATEIHVTINYACL